MALYLLWDRVYEDKDRSFGTGDNERFITQDCVKQGGQKCGVKILHIMERVQNRPNIAVK